LNMLYLYLDESGDLGFDFANRKPSRFFTLTILAVKGNETNRRLLNAVKKTIKRKLNPQGKRKNMALELKGAKITWAIKQYFYQQIKDIDFSIYAVTLNKIKACPELIRNRTRLYNFIARLVLEQIPLLNSKTVVLVVDRAKNKREIAEFNESIRQQLEIKLIPLTQADIQHLDSLQNGGLQAADMFSHGVFTKYESQRNEWFNLFAGKVKYESVYLP